MAQETPSATEAVNLDEDIQSQDLGVREPRILPDSPFYFLKEITRGLQSFFTFDSVAKAELRLKFANEKLMELKKLAEIKPEAVPEALENYKAEIDRLEEAVGQIKVGAIGKETQDFINKFVDNNLKQQKLFGKLEKDLPPEIYEKMEGIKEEGLTKFSDIGLKLLTPEVLQEKIIGALEDQPGSNFKQFKNLEVLQEIKEKVPESAKPAIQQAIENSLKRLKGDLEKMSPADAAQFKDYVENIGGNETRHLAVMGQLEKEELSLIVREEMAKAKAKILERVETRLKEYGEKNLETASKKFLDHLAEQGEMENLRTVKELENNLSPEVSAQVLDVKREIVQKVVEKIGLAETPAQQKEFFENVENKYYDVQQLEVFKEIEELIPAEKKELYEKLKEKLLLKMKEEVERAKKLGTEEKTAIVEKLAGDVPEHIQILEGFKSPPEVTRQTVENIARKIETMENPAKAEILKQKLEEEKIKERIEIVKPQVFEKLEQKSETLMRALNQEQVASQIGAAKNTIEMCGRTTDPLQPELRDYIRNNPPYKILMDGAFKHLQEAERALAEQKFGEAFGQATAANQQASNACNAVSDVIAKKLTEGDRLNKWKEFLKRLYEVAPEVFPYGYDEKAVPSITILINCSFPDISIARACKGAGGKVELSVDPNRCPYFKCRGQVKELPCAGEEEKVNRESSMGLTNQLCCAGLREIKISQSYSICKKEIMGVECNVDVDCPQPLCSEKTSKCYEGKCFIPACIQIVPPVVPSLPTSTPTPAAACPQATKLEELIPAVGPEGVCKKFMSVCDVPQDWKRVEACPEPVFAPDMVGCCLEGTKACIQAPKEKCLAEGGQGVPASYCSIADICFRLSAPLKILIAPTSSPTAIPSDLIGCCMNYSCNLASKEVCAAAGGREIGPASECDITYICGQVGCCFEGGICKPMIQKDCLLKGGKPYGSSCSPNQCPISILTPTPTPTEIVACCFKDGMCKLENKEECIAKGAKVSASSCSPNPCPQPAPTASSDYISCTKGGMKDHACSDGTMVSWQCKCLNIIPQATAYYVWNCVLRPTNFCSVSEVSTQPAISEIEIRHYGSSIQIFWQTNIPTISYMEYGTTTSYGFRAGGLSAAGSLDTPGTQFVVEGQHLSIGSDTNAKLRSDTVYHFRIVAEDTKGNTLVSQDYTFATVPECVIVGTKEVKKYYACPNGTRVDWCKCTAEGKWDCIASPENACPVSTVVPPPIPVPAECKVGEVKQYACSDGTSVSWCKCVSEGKWDCIASPEKSCPVPATTPVPSATTEKILKLISPNGGEKWLMEKTYDITWISQNVEKVNMELAVFKDNTRLGALGIDLNISASIGKYSWQIPASQHIRDGNNFKVVIRNAETPVNGVSDPATLPEDESDAYFSIVDVTSPVISVLTAVGITSATAKIEWDTNEPSTSLVVYGTTDIYHTGNELQISDSSLVIHHSVPISNLQANTLYHYRVESKDAAGNLTFSDSKFFTTAEGPTGFIENQLAFIARAISQLIEWAQELIR